MTLMPNPVTNVFSRDDKLGTVMRDARARAVLQRHMPELQSLSTILTLGGHPLSLVARTSPALAGPDDVQALFEELESLPPEPADDSDRRGQSPERAARIFDQDSAPSSAVVSFAQSVSRYETFEAVFQGPSNGNPFCDVELSIQLESPSGRIEVPGFYDGDGTYRVRCLVEETGPHRFRSVSNAPSLDAIEGRFDAHPDPGNRRGPVRVHDRHHFAYATGQRYVPVGTTAYAWTHQGDTLEERTLASLETSPFNKIRMCIFPKSYIFNENEPSLYPFVGGPEQGFDFERFDERYWRHLETRVQQLDDLGIQADLILFHPYDRWGFSDMGAAADDRYLQYAVARLGGFQNVWWSLANEYDLMPTKSEDDWERFAAIVKRNDPAGHLLSIHNCFDFYDHGRAWVTHASVQRQDIYKTAEMTDQWRERWAKPIVVDECGYEGDIDQGWGNITGVEMVRRFWEGAVRGGYVGHGETYLRERDELWWSKGGDLIGSSPARIRFLREILEDAPFGLDPVNTDWDIPSAGRQGEYLLFYFGFSQPRFRRFLWDPEVEYTVDVIDTWNMTVERLPGTVSGRFTVDMPGKPYIALRFQATTSAQFRATA